MSEQQNSHPLYEIAQRWRWTLTYIAVIVTLMLAVMVKGLW